MSQDQEHEKGRRSWDLDGAVDQESGDITIGGQVFHPVTVTRGVQRRIHAHQRTINKLNRRRARAIKGIQDLIPGDGEVLPEEREDELAELEEKRDETFVEIEAEMARTIQVLLGGEEHGPTLEHLEASTDVRFTDVLFGHLMGAIDANDLTATDDPDPDDSDVVEGSARDRAGDAETSGEPTDPRLTELEQPDGEAGGPEPDPTPTTPAPDATAAASTPPATHAPSAVATDTSATASASTGG